MPPTLLTLLFLAGTTAVLDTQQFLSDQASPGIADPAFTMTGRETDARVARIAFRLANAGRARCPVVMTNAGLVLQHLSQFQLADRAGMTAGQPLDRGPEVIVVVPGSPADMAGVRAGDVLLSLDGAALPPEQALDQPFDVERARARADEIDDLLTGAHRGPFQATLLRDGAVLSVGIYPRATCPSRVHLARSTQRNAYADGRHVFLTTGLLARLRNDNELAFILAHEMAHNILGHAAIMRSGDVKHRLGRTLGHSGTIVRGIERAADALAGDLMIDAGFDPVAGAGALEHLDSGSGIDLFSDHDGNGTRIAAMRAIVQARTGAMTGRDFYQVLGVTRNASSGDIRTAYVRLAKRHHPDLSGELPRRLSEVQQAYRCLSDPERRTAHDNAITEGERAHADRQRRVQRRLHGYDHRHPRPHPRRQRRWRWLIFAMAGMAVVAGVSLIWLV